MHPFQSVLSALWLLLLLVATPATCLGGTTQIFILHSYSQEYPWTKRQHEGFVRALSENQNEAQLFSVEYLDTKRRSYTTDYQENFSAFLATKYADYLPDIIYVTDDNALQFSLTYLNNIFPGIPVVFSGVNNMQVLNTISNTSVTGVFEKKNIVRNIQLLKDSGSVINKIVFVGDASNTYKSIESEAITALRGFPDIEPVFIAAPQIDDIIAALSEQAAGFVFLTTLGAVKDQSGRSVPLRETIHRITQAGDYAVLTMEDVYMQEDVLGGYVTSGFRQGEEAARLASLTLSWGNDEVPAPVTESPNEYLFDYRELTQHRLVLPQSISSMANILNTPDSFYQRYRSYILGALIFLASLLFITLVTAYILLSRKNRMISLHAATLDNQHNILIRTKESLQEAQQIARIGNWDWNLLTGELYWSRGIYDLFGTHPDEFQPAYEAFLSYVHPDDRDMVDATVKKALTTREIYDIQHRIILADGQTKTVHERGNAEYDAEGNPVRMIGTIQDITAEKKAEEQLRDLATADTLTRLPNRNTLLDRLGQAIHRAHRNKAMLGLLFLDLDRFKQINDSLGHAVGDRLLIQAADRLRALVRNEDTVARLGGDEFVVLLEELADPGDAGLVAEKIIDAFNTPFKVDDYSLFVTTSIGISIFPQDGEDRIALLKHADTAMYHAKDSGRNSYSFYTAEITQRVAARVELEHKLRNALNSENFELYYQPIYTLADHRIIATEALLRWHDADLGQVSPADFIPVAEDSGIIVQLGAWVMWNACQTIKRWDDGGLLPEQMRININVSGIQLLQHDFIDQIKRILSETGASPHRVMIELTEGVLLENKEDSVATLNELVALGIEVAVDDFGTGYSSLSYLKALPISTIKLDRSFVRDLSHDENDRAISRAIIGLGTSLGLKVVAEGIESEEQESFLISEGCQLGQGFKFQRPVSEMDFEELIKGSSAEKPSS